MLNLMDVQPGHIIRLKSGATAEVVDNVGDGMWLKALLGGEEELVFCEDIAELVAAPTGARP